MTPVIVAFNGHVVKFALFVKNSIVNKQITFLGE